MSIQEEQQFLDKVLETIKKEMKSAKEECEVHYSDLLEHSENAWNNKSELDTIELASIRGEADATASLAKKVYDKHTVLDNALARPYFGIIKVDFDGEVETFRIGEFSITDGDEELVIDWRAPIAALFYDPTMGKTSFEVDGRTINCTLLDRKQVIIDNGKVLGLTADRTQILQEILSKNTNGQMDQIVATIQTEQDKIIRSRDLDSLVQGYAGSGKTSVALHRIAYLVYLFRSNPESVLILSPTNYFSSYIAHVIPTLTQSDVRCETFYSYFREETSDFDTVETLYDFLARSYDRKKNCIQDLEDRFKFSDDYKKAIDKFILRYVSSFKFSDKDDFTYGGEYYPSDIINALIAQETSLDRKVEAVASYLHDDYRKRKGYKKSINEKSLQEYVRQKLFGKKPKIADLYNKFLESPEYIEAFGRKVEKLSKKKLNYPDLMGLLYLQFELYGYPEAKNVRQLVIDEVQDYSPLQISILSKIFRGSAFSFFGDRLQGINSKCRYNTLDEIIPYTKRTDIKQYELNNAYRSSPEIINHVKKFFDIETLNPIRTVTGIPVERKNVAPINVTKLLAKDVKKLKEKGFKRICIITKTSGEAQELYERLASENRIEFLENLSKTPASIPGEVVFVSSACDAKGLEFDAVICYSTPSNNFNQSELPLYYVACTRALHSLTVYNEPKRLLVNKATYPKKYIPQSEELSLSAINDYLTYDDSPYLQDFLDYINDQHSEQRITPIDFERMVKRYCSKVGEKLTDEFNGKSESNKKLRQRELFRKMDLLEKVIRDAAILKNGMCDEVELAASIPFYDAETAREVCSDIGIRPAQNLKSTMTQLVEFFYPKLVKDFRSYCLPFFGTADASYAPNMVSEQDILDNDYKLVVTTNGETKTKEITADTQKEEIIEYMKRRRIPFFARAYYAVANKYLTTGLEEKPKAKRKSQE